jgi:2-oxoglutarate ferredoxin oxidoreductase subunit beta
MPEHAASNGARNGSATNSSATNRGATESSATAGRGAATGPAPARGASGNASGHANGNGNGSAAAAAEGEGHRLASLELVPKAQAKQTVKDFKTDQEVRWCPGCGDYAILAAFQSFLPELGIPRENLAIISGIGCSSRLPYYVNSYGMHSIHGRAPAIATGLAASRQDLSVWVITGDGDALSIGGNHLIHALRRNVNIKILLFNNRIYGLTKGQYSPTSEQGKVTKSTPFGSLDTPFNPVSLAIGAEAGFVARTIDSDRKHLTSVLRAAADLRGTAFIEIYQNCPIFNDDAFTPVTAPGSREEHLIRLEHGEPVRFGADGGQGLRFTSHGSLEAVPVAGTDPDSLLVHDAHAADPSYAFALSRLDRTDFAHTPIGIFRQVPRTSYDDAMTAQIEAARKRQGAGDLAALLAGPDTWLIS